MRILAVFGLSGQLLFGLLLAYHLHNVLNRPLPSGIIEDTTSFRFLDESLSIADYLWKNNGKLAWMLLIGAKRKNWVERQEEKLKNNSRDLSLVKMKSMFAIGFAFTALLSMFNSIFDGRVVAKLPFTPISLMQGLSHRNLGGDDYTHCSFIFLYILCTMSIRQNIQKMLGLAPSRVANKQGVGFFSPPPQFGK